MEPYERTIGQAAEAIRARELSPVELTRSVLERAEATEDRLHAYVLVLAEQALEAAAAAEKEIADGGWRGPLHGIPIGIKDLVDIAGVPTTSSSEVRADHVAAADAAVVTRLREAGAVLVGKTHMHEFAYGVITPTTRNPWSTEHVPGGSSGGSAAAVAAGTALAALGSDTGGSIRIPASACGVVGIKPTYGRVSRVGVTSLCWALDHVGPLARTVRDAALMLNVLAGFDPRDPGSTNEPVPDYTVGLDQGVEGLTVGVPANYFFDNLDPQVEGVVRGAIARLEQAGATLRPVEIPYAAHAAHYLAVEFGLVVPEASAYHQQMLRDRGERYTDATRMLLEAGELMPATAYLKALRARTLIAQGWRNMFEGLDAVVAPTLPAAAARVGQDGFTWSSGDSEAVINAYVRYSCPANITGLPALSVPCGLTDESLPIGLQIIGRPFDEATVLRVGGAYETAGDWEPRLAPLR